jgi:uncharacterized oxidoreductase
MKTTNNTVLITGGSAGIGLEMARLFSERGNEVIITGRNKGRLLQAAANLGNVTPIVSDVSNTDEVHALVEQLKDRFPALNIVVNNAGSAFVYNLATGTGAFEKAQEEMLTNYLAVVRLNELLLPLLKGQRAAAIVNVSSIVAFVPGSLATYSASKAALHSYTQSLRRALSAVTNIKVFELMPPLVNTSFSEPIGGVNGIAPSIVADDLLDALARDEYEIRVGDTEQIYQLSLSSPAEAFNAMNRQPVS